jgi:hypothetical protein
VIIARDPGISDRIGRLRGGTEIAGWSGPARRQKIAISRFFGNLLRSSRFLGFRFSFSFSFFVFV